MAAIVPIVMPKWGLSMKEGTVNEWLVDEGARITVGMPILEVETDKIANAVEAADAGTLRRKIAQPGETLPVKALLGVMADAQVPDADIDVFVAGYAVPPAEADEGGDGVPAYLFTDVDGIRVRYARRGGGGSTVVLLHGFGGDLDNWLFNLDALAERSEVIALDLPAHGQSAIALPGTSLAELSRFVLRFLDALAVHGPVHLVGHSLGGSIAAQMALDAPERVASLALICSAGLGDEIDAGYTEGFVAAQSRRELKPVLQRLFADPQLVSGKLVDDVLRYKRIDGVAELLGRLGAAQFGAGRQHEQPVRRLAGTGKRVLVVWGAQDKVIPARHAADAPAGATVKVLEGAGHMVQMEKPGEVNDLLRRHVEG